MGLSMGGTSSNSTAASTSTPTFSGAQGGIQQLLSSVLSSLLPSVSSGGISPNVQATEAQANDQTNKNYASMSDRMSKFTAARGFGQSGQVGQNQLTTELSRQGALAGNASDAASKQLGLDTTFLSDALAYAFAQPGSTATKTGSDNGSSWGANAAATFAF